MNYCFKVELFQCLCIPRFTICYACRKIIYVATEFIRPVDRCIFIRYTIVTTDKMDPLKITFRTQLRQKHLLFSLSGHGSMGATRFHLLKPYAYICGIHKVTVTLSGCPHTPATRQYHTFQ